MATWEVCTYVLIHADGSEFLTLQNLLYLHNKVIPTLVNIGIPKANHLVVGARFYPLLAIKRAFSFSKAITTILI